MGAGAARGIAHIGILQVLEENKIPIDVLAGTSAGALIGLLYACGVDLRILARMTESLNWDDLVSLTITKLGLVSSERIHQMLRMLTRDKRFEDLSRPCAVVATDINTGEEVVIDKGLVADGVRASISIPGVFVPTTVGKRMLVDGALVNRVPVSTARRLGADIVIACDVGHPQFHNKVGNLSDIVLRTIDILERQCSKLQTDVGDVVICPDLGNVGSTQLNRAPEIISKGREAASGIIDEIGLLTGKTSR